MNSIIEKLAVQNALTLKDSMAYGPVHGIFITLCKEKKHVQLYVYAGCHHKGDNQPPAQPDSTGFLVPAHLVSASNLAQFLTKEASAHPEYLIPCESAALNKNQFLQGIAVKNGYLVQVNFLDNRNRTDHIQMFIDTVLPKLDGAGRPDECMKCGQETGEPFVPVLVHGRAVVPMHADCAREYTEAAEAAGKCRKAASPKPGLFARLFSRQDTGQTKILKN